MVMHPVNDIINHSSIINRINSKNLKKYLTSQKNHLQDTQLYKIDRDTKDRFKIQKHP